MAKKSVKVDEDSYKGVYGRAEPDNVLRMKLLYRRF